MGLIKGSKFDVGLYLADFFMYSVAQCCYVAHGPLVYSSFFLNKSITRIYSLRKISVAMLVNELILKEFCSCCGMEFLSNYFGRVSLFNQLFMYSYTKQNFAN